jgi:hypothetical protein
MAFDCLYLEGRALRDRPLRERRGELERVLENDQVLLFAARRLGADGLGAWAQVVERGYEGLVGKDEASTSVALEDHGDGQEKDRGAGNRTSHPNRSASTLDRQTDQARGHSAGVARSDCGLASPGFLVNRAWKKVAWGYTLQTGGKQERKFSADWTKDDAQNELAKRLLERDAPPAPAVPKTLGLVAQEYLDYKRGKGTLAM